MENCESFKSFGYIYLYIYIYIYIDIDYTNLAAYNHNVIFYAIIYGYCKGWICSQSPNGWSMAQISQNNEFVREWA